MATASNTTTLSRRAMFGGAGKIIAASALASTPVALMAFGGGDGQIVAAFYRWRDAVIAYRDSPGDGESDEWCAMVDHAEGITDRIAEMPETGTEGLAIKSYLALRHEIGCGGNEFVINFDGATMSTTALYEGLVKDCLRMSPALASVVNVGVN